MSYNYYNVASVREQLLSKGGNIVGDPISEPDVVELQRNNWTVKCPPDTQKASANCVTWLNVGSQGLRTITIAIYYFCDGKPGCNDPNGGAVSIQFEKQVMSLWGIKVEQATVPKDDVEYLVSTPPKAFR